MSETAAILAHPKAKHRVDCGDRAYWLETPKVHDRARMQGELLRRGFMPVRPVDKIDVMIQAVEQLLDLEDPERQEHVDRLREVRARLLDDPEAEVPAEVDDLHAILVRHVDRLAEMQAQEQVFFTAYSTVAAELFVTAWEGFEGRYRRGLDGKGADECLRQIPQADMIHIGAAVAGMMNPSKATEKNFGSPSGTRSEPTRSNSQAPTSGPESDRHPMATDGTSPSSAPDG